MQYLQLTVIDYIAVRYTAVFGDGTFWVEVNVLFLFFKKNSLSEVK